MAKPPTRAALEKRVKDLNFDSLAAAVTYLEAIDKAPGSAFNPIRTSGTEERVEQPRLHPEPRVR